MFVELGARSCFSFLRGASQPEQLIERARELELGGIALCDRDGLYGSVRAHVRARELGQRFIVGAELTLGAEPLPARGALEPVVVLLLVQNRRGYSNLCRLLTRAHADQPKGQSLAQVSWLAEHQEGLCAVLPVGLRPSARPVQQELLEEELLDLLAQSFGGRAAIGIYRYLDGEDKARFEIAVDWQKRFGLPLLATARPLYHVPECKALLDVLHCIRRGITLESAGTELGQNREAHLRSEAEMLRLFRENPGWVHATGEFAADLGFQLSELEYHFPCTLEPGESADIKLGRLAREGLMLRYPEGVPGAVAEQVEKELRLIEKMKKASYFLTAWEIVELAKARRILCQGRGSAANSAVCYALGVTAVDPARSNLLFERFMSEERDEPPDIDLDFEHERREEVISDIYARYGRERAAMVSEVIRFRGRSALREVGRVFGLSQEQAERLSATLTHWDGPEVSARRLEEMGFSPGDARLQEVLRLAQQLQGLPRHLSIHVGGFVLSAEPLTEIAPVEPARMPGRTVIPWDKDDLEELGFFKIDILSLGMLTAIRKALAMIYEAGGLRVAGEKGEGLGESMSELGPTGTTLTGTGESFDPISVLARVPPKILKFTQLCAVPTP